mmetsp:Transcript_34061/g.33256  ORF Transcript_34061/g.33256 Transcript_34061/m.33256 type:complete len:90 (+) Transcript_34061:381-650(+)
MISNVNSIFANKENKETKKPRQRATEISLPIYTGSTNFLKGMSKERKMSELLPGDIAKNLLKRQGTFKKVSQNIDDIFKSKSHLSYGSA